MNIRDRDPKDIVKAINIYGRTSPKVVTARKLRSSDITIIFHREIEQNMKNKE
jgi:predicted RNA-binding protein